jgi:alanyl-tRNA synthetase
MTERLYYRDSFLREFPATVLEVVPGNRPGIVLDRTAFYPTSGGQLFDTGILLSDKGTARVAEVAEDDDGRILHFVEGEGLPPGTQIRGEIDGARRRDHMQQHSGQHVLSAAFIRLFELETMSFHMGDESSTIDLSTSGLNAQQIEEAETLANDIVLEDRPVDIRFVSRDEAQGLGLRKIPPAARDRLRLIDICDFDLTACGGTHVIRTGQIGGIVLRKTEKVKQGWRVEFVCGNRAVRTARRDFRTLTEAAGLVSGHIWELPQQIGKLQANAKTLRKSQADLLEEIASYHANQLLTETPEHNGRKVIVQVFPDRDLEYVKLLAQRVVRQGTAICFFASISATPAVLFAQSAGQPHNMGALMKEALVSLGGGGGGSKDIAQGGPKRIDSLDRVLQALAVRARE